MTDTGDRSEQAREDFEFFSAEYAQALQAFKAIENPLLLLGVSEDLRGFVDQFIEMATKTKRLAEEREQTHFAEWFEELIDKAETLRGAIPQR